MRNTARIFLIWPCREIYTRIMNPTNDVLEQRVAAMEGGVAALALASGQAAINYSILNLAEAGNNIVSVPQLYGGTWTLFRHMLPKQGIKVRFADDDSVDGLAKLIDSNTRAVFCESIGNPAGNISDLQAIAIWRMRTAYRSSSTIRCRRLRFAVHSSMAAISFCIR